MDLRTGFLDSAFELPRKNCWLAPRDKQTLWLGCLAKDYSATWVEPVERDMDALRKSAAAFPDMTRAFPTYVLNGGPPRSIGVNDYTATLLSSGSCDRDERSGACILEGRSRRNIAWAPLYGEVAMQDVSDDIFLLNAKNGALLVRQLGTDGRIADVAGSMRVDAVSSVDLVGAYESGPRHITAVLSAHTRPDSFYTVDVSLNDGRASVQPEPNVHDHQLSMDGPRGVECIDGRARRTTDGGTTWSDVALPSAALDTHSSSHRHVVHASEVGIDAGHGYVVGWGDLDSPTPEPAPRPAPIAEPQWVKESSRPSPWALLCARDGRPSTPRSPPESPTVTEVPRPRAYPSWTMSWTDETGSKRVWRGEPPEIAEHVEIRAWKTLGQNAAFVVSYQGPRGDEHTIARAIGDKVELSPPRTGSTDDLAIGAGGVAWHDDVAFLWPAGKPASEIRSVRKVGFDIGIEPPASPGFLTFRMRPPEGAQFLSVADTSSPKDPPPLPVFGWISEDALVSDTPPRACGPNAKASVTVEGGVHLLELERNDDPLPPLESVSVSWGTIRLGYDGALDPKNVCLAGVVAEIGDQRDERGERRLSYRADTGRDVSETEKASQPMRCELMSATEYARRSATRPQ